MSVADREKWDRKWAERGEPGEPAAFVRSVADRLPTEGTALDVAGGAGRHALWLARRGLTVTLVDVSPEALRIAREAAAGLPVTCVELDLEEQPLPEGRFDLVVCTHFYDPRVWGQLASRLAPGGLALVIQPTVENLQRNARPARPHLIAPGSLLSLVPGLEPLVLEEDWSPEGRHEARLLGRAATR